MSKLKKTLMAFMVVMVTCVTPIAATVAYGAGELTGADGQVVDSNANATSKKRGGGFFSIVFNGDDLLGTFLWLVIFTDLGLAIYFIIDNSILIKPEKLMPPVLVTSVQQAMAEGDVVKAMQVCEANPSAMSSIVLAAFQHVEEGFEAIQEAVNAASDLEQEKIQQRLNWISVCGNLGPSLGLLGAVEGMILTFAQLASGAAGDAAALAGSIGQALYTTAGGLVISIPAITFFYSLRNKANRLILRMTAVTMELLNGLRNVEVAPEEGAGELAMEEMPQ